MAKMMKPEVEAIRLRDNDVIAASGHAISHGQYHALGSEVNQADTRIIRELGDYFVVDFSAESGYRYGTNKVSEDKINENNYAWYNNSGHWVTDDRTIGDYKNSGQSLPQ